MTKLKELLAAQAKKFTHVARVVEFFDDPAQFKDVAAPFFEDDPFSANVVATHVSAVLSGARHEGDQDMWATVSPTGAVSGVAVHTPPHNLFVSRMTPRCAHLLAEATASAKRKPPGVTGGWRPSSGVNVSGRRFLREVPVQRRRTYTRDCTSITHRAHPRTDRRAVRLRG